MLIAGADPGAQGAIALLDAETRRVLRIVDMPMSGSDLLVRELVMDLTETLDGRRVGHLFVERQAPFIARKERKDGGGTHIRLSAACRLIEREMAIRAIAACFGWPTERPTPVKWKRHFGLSADKERSLVLADELMPLDANLWRVRRGSLNKAQAIGRAEAALIGLYGSRILAGIARIEAPIIEGLRASLAEAADAA